MTCTNFSRMIHLLAIACLGLFTKVEAQVTHMGTEFLVQFPYMPEGQPILMMYSAMMEKFEVYITAPISPHAVFERVRLKHMEVKSYTVPRKYLTPLSGITSPIATKAKHNFGMTVFLAISIHSAASFQAIPVAGWGMEYFVLVPKLGPSIIVISLDNENEIKFHFSETFESLESHFTENLLSTVSLSRKEAYIMQNCTGRTVGEQPLGLSPVKVTAMSLFGVIVGSCEEYEFKSECERANIKVAGGATAEMVLSLRSWGKQFILPSILKKSCEQNLRFLTHQPNTVILITSNDETQVINVDAGGVLETQRLNSPFITYIKTSKQIMLYVDYEYPCVKEDNFRFEELVMVVPIHLFINEYVWSTPSARGYTPAHYISIVAPIDNFFIEIDTQKVSLKWKRDTINRWQTTFSRLEPGTHYISSLTGVAFGMYVVGLTPDYQFIHIAGFQIGHILDTCEGTATRYNDGLDNDCDGSIDEERENQKDDDRDGFTDEDIASYSSINVKGLSLPLPPPVPPFVVGYLSAECPCPSVNSCQMEMCNELTAYIVCLESIVTLTNCDIHTRMAAMKKLRLREIQNSSLSTCISRCPTFLHSCIPNDAEKMEKLSCSHFASYLQCLKAVSNNPSCSRSFRDEAVRWIVSTENLDIKDLCIQDVSMIIKDEPAKPQAKDWHQITDKCIKLIQEKKQYAEAVEACSKLDSQLLTIVSQQDSSDVNDILNKVEVNSSYIALIKNGAQWQWDTGVTSLTLSFTLWPEGSNTQNNSNDDGKNCTIMDKTIALKWLPVLCTSEHSFICQKSSCGAEPIQKSALSLTKNSIYQIEDKFYISNSDAPSLRALVNMVREQEKLLILRGKCPADPETCKVAGSQMCVNIKTQLNCFGEIFRNRKCSKKIKSLSADILSEILSTCYPAPAGGTTVPTDSTIPEGQTDFPINIYVTSADIFEITETISTRDPASSVTGIQTTSQSQGANCEDLFKTCEPSQEKRIAWCKNVDSHWNCMKGLLNTKICGDDIRNRASDWMIANGRPVDCPPPSTTESPESVIAIEDLICGPAPVCEEVPFQSEAICQEGHPGRNFLICLNEIIDRVFCYPKKAEDSKLARMAISDSILEFNCEGLNYDAVQFLKFEPDCEQCITLGMSTLFFYYYLNTTLTINGQCNNLYFDYCTGDDNECHKIDSWATACTFASDCTGFLKDNQLRIHPIEAMCNVWEDEESANQLIVTIPTLLFRSVNYRFRTRLSSDFSASNKSAMVGVSRVFIVKKLVDDNKAIVEPRSTSGAENPHGLSIFWYIAVAALNVAALVTGV